MRKTRMTTESLTSSRQKTKGGSKMPDREFNLDELVAEIDNMYCTCDHTTWVFKLPIREEDEEEASYEVVGRLCVKKKTWYLTEVKHIVVDESVRRRGIGTRMMEFITAQPEGESQESRIIITPLVGGTVDVTNVTCQSFLQSLGYLPCCEFKNKGTGNDILFMIKSLSPVSES
jgi:ribosomal protein S18 acetylase RimI-like enzyme